MSVDVVMPQMGESIFEGTITKWLKKAGDQIQRDEPLFEISTDKVDAEIPAPSAGVLKEIKVGEGKTVPVQTVVAVIEEAGAAARATAAPPAPPASVPAPVATKPAAPAPPPVVPEPVSTQPAAPKPAAAPPVPAAPPVATSSEEESDEEESESGDGRKIHSSPLVRRLANENNIDLSTLTGSGAGGRISKKDILAAIQAASSRPAPVAASAAAPPPAVAAAEAARSVTVPPPSSTAVPPAAAPLSTGAPPAAPSSSGGQFHAAFESAVPRERMYFGTYEIQPMSTMRQKIGEHMVASKHVSPHVYSVEQADMTRITKLRERSKAEFESKSGTKLSFMPFFIRACVEGLRAFPTVNSSVDGNTLVLHRDINLGIAVALDWGLIVPVIKNAEEKSFLGLARSMNDLAERARAKKLKPEEVQESTFSITNPGVYGGLMGLPVINQPNVAILGIGAIEKRPVVVDDAIAIRSMVYLTLSYDHRAVDGAIAHQFMSKVRAHLEGWSEEIL